LTEIGRIPGLQILESFTGAAGTERNPHRLQFATSLKEITMNRHFAHALAFATTTAAIACAAVMAASPAYAESPTIETRPFVSTRSRADVQAELMGRRQELTAAASEWTMQHNQVPQIASAYTSQEVRAQYIASREEVSALTSEDSGSSYLSRHAARMNASTVMAGVAR
jgi:hypothetical protein